MSSRPPTDERSVTLVRAVPASGFALGRARCRCDVALRVGLVIVLGASSFVAVAHARPTPCFHGCFSSEQDVARGMVGELAELAFAGWAAANPGRARPSSLEDMVPFANRKRLGTDPWGAPYAMAPSEVGIRVASAGPDRAFGTADDIAWSTP